MTYAEIKTRLAEARAEYRARQAEAAEHEAALRAITETVKELSKQLKAFIIEGAKPCPDCGELPIGLEQPNGPRRKEFEIGCPSLSCMQPFQHTDGTKRLHRVRGGLIPRHAVEAWNEGPDFWMEPKEAVPTVQPASEGDT